MRETPTVGGADGAAYAAGLASAALGGPGPVPELLEAVNGRLYGLGPGLLAAARPSATAAVAEITLADGALHVQAWAAGDAQVWVREHAGWRMLVGGSSCTAETKQRWAPQRDALRAAGVPFWELQQREAEFYDDPALFVHHTPLGRFEHLLVQHRSAVASEVVCATDGALLDADALLDLPGWIATVRDVEARGVARIKPTDDLAVISASITAGGTTDSVG